MTGRFTLPRTSRSPAIPLHGSADRWTNTPRTRPAVQLPPVRQVPQTAPQLPSSHAVRSARGLTSFLGLLSVDGVLLEANQPVSSPPELSGHAMLGQPFWEAAWWNWSPSVQERLRGSVARVATGGVIRYNETALVRRNQLITVDLAWVPAVRAGRVTALICSVVDLSGARETRPADDDRQE